MARAVPAQDYIRREVLVSMAINAVISLGFFLLVFGPSQPAPVWGVGGWVFDFLPQGFMVALMGTIVPGLIASRKRARGAVAPLDKGSRLPRTVLPLAVLLAAVSALAGTMLVALIVWLSDISSLSPLAGSGLKIVFGGLLGGLVTYTGLNALLSRR
ncbi:hypothetical protein [Novosphingobium sp. Leaf2]|uniref:hypothetical protein n=1 Tax=Novosphingobium sp. Leaf2 TaxID=1735670 RepID=UPI0006FE7A54|nr:hypothetical protein [Novosphingobium sp. Leaf2]KQM14798.1 hypothetical protein ASE49_11605 [Novosphingobium sp. Leaf2]